MLRFLLLPLALAGTAPAAILVTDLATGDADWNDTLGNTSLSIGTPEHPNGHTVNLEFTPATADLSGTVVLFDFGGTSNGFALTLVNGVLTYSAKHNSGDNQAPDSLNDTTLGTSSREIAVQASLGALSAGTAYSAAVSWNPATLELQLGIEDAGQTSGSLQSITMTGDSGNWSGNDSVSFGELFNSAGGLGGELAGVTVPDPWDVDDTPINSFAGTKTAAYFWNDIGTVSAVPEPAATVLGLFGALGLLRRRR